MGQFASLGDKKKINKKLQRRNKKLMRISKVVSHRIRVTELQGLEGTSGDN